MPKKKATVSWPSTHPSLLACDSAITPLWQPASPVLLTSLSHAPPPLFRQAKNSARGFATTSVIKKKDDVPAKDAATDPLQTPAADAAAAGVKSGTLTPSTTTAAATSNGSSTPNTARGAGTATPPSTAAGDWDDSDETRQLEEKRELAERVKVASEKEASKVLKVLEYEKRTASVLPEFFWDDRLNLVSPDSRAPVEHIQFG